MFGSSSSSPISSKRLNLRPPSLRFFILDLREYLGTRSAIAHSLKTPSQVWWLATSYLYLASQNLVNVQINDWFLKFGIRPWNIGPLNW